MRDVAVVIARIIQVRTPLLELPPLSDAVRLELFEALRELRREFRVASQHLCGLNRVPPNVACDLMVHHADGV